MSFSFCSNGFIIFINNESLLQKEKLFRILSFRSFMLVHQRPIVSKTLARERLALSDWKGVLSCRKISRCKWLVTDPPQCRTNLRDHFPRLALHFTSERCDARATSELVRERSAPRDGSGTTHVTHRTVWCAAAHVFLPLAISESVPVASKIARSPIRRDGWVAWKIDMVFTQRRNPTGYISLITPLIRSLIHL